MLKAPVRRIKVKKGNEETIAKLMHDAQGKKIPFDEFVAEARKLGGESVYGELQIESENQEAIKELLDQFNAGKLTIDTFITKVRERGDKAEFWNYETDENPQYKGNNKTRTTFKYNPGHHIKGKFFQSIIKKAVLRAIDFAHANIIKHYDSKAFIYDDERLKVINGYCKGYINKNFQHAYPYKSGFMNKVVDIILFFAKEDIYYTARWLDMINNLPRGHELTKEEQTNISKWH